MTADLERRIARLGATYSAADGMVERELTDEGKDLLRETWAGLHSPELIERIVSAKTLSPQTLSLESEEYLAEIADSLSDIPTWECRR